MGNEQPTPPLNGWHFIAGSGKRHYFQDGESLCRRFSGPQRPHPEPPTGLLDYYNCVPCDRKLKTGSTRRRRRG